MRKASRLYELVLGINGGWGTAGPLGALWAAAMFALASQATVGRQVKGMDMSQRYGRRIGPLAGSWTLSRACMLAERPACLFVFAASGAR